MYLIESARITLLLIDMATWLRFERTGFQFSSRPKVHTSKASVDIPKVFPNATTTKEKSYASVVLGRPLKSVIVQASYKLNKLCVGDFVVEDFEKQRVVLLGKVNEFHTLPAFTGLICNKGFSEMELRVESTEGAEDDVDLDGDTSLSLDPFKLPKLIVEDSKKKKKSHVQQIKHVFGSYCYGSDHVSPLDDGLDIGSDMEVGVKAT
ncbi:hypothetical protein L2E82_15600 [Cichorium intybus]|uniref:Uncharacterized protein n=1 Tax=Cichorium intybus TaxID=13427 RepID=A0ACB9F384_CICIN|nr:hypothetical protein L2E82_15600 [Cichorium intybus]